MPGIVPLVLIVSTAASLGILLWLYVLESGVPCRRKAEINRLQPFRLRHGATKIAVGE